MVTEMKIKSTKKLNHTVVEPKWSAQMLESFEQAKRGEIHKIDVNNFWDL